jgi:hypothetical protein
MRRQLVPVLSLLLLTAGCDASVSELNRVADSTRNATEHAAILADAASDAREANIYAAAARIDAREKAAAGIQENGGRPRYEIRQDGAGDRWVVYDTVNNRNVRSGVRTQSGLSHADAEALFSSLQNEDQSNPGLAAGDPLRARTR